MISTTYPFSIFAYRYAINIIFKKKRDNRINKRNIFANRHISADFNYRMSPIIYPIIRIA